MSIQQIGGYFLLYHCACVLFFGTGLILEWSDEKEVAFKKLHGVGFSHLMVLIIGAAWMLLPIYILRALLGSKNDTK